MCPICVLVLGFNFSSYSLSYRLLSHSCTKSVSNYRSLVHILRERKSISKDTYIKGRTHLVRGSCFVLITLRERHILFYFTIMNMFVYCFVIYFQYSFLLFLWPCCLALTLLWCFELSFVTFAFLFSLHCVFMLNMHTSICFVH